MRTTHALGTCGAVALPPFPVEEDLLLATSPPEVPTPLMLKDVLERIDDLVDTVRALLLGAGLPLLGAGPMALQPTRARVLTEVALKQWDRA